ncbi:MAG TPA: hypothetical protein VFU32_15385 [Ktedonobacterales bacterium]|nr:hypothetical protein [Ktedonobacterales bacterium]
MNKQDIIQTIGPERYQALEAWVRDHLSDEYGMTDMPDEQQDEALQGINGMIWSAPDLADFQRVELVCQFYSDLPILHFPYYVAENYAALTPYARAIFWDFAREHLFAGKQGFWMALLQSIMLDFFAHPDLFEEAWSELTGPQASERVIAGILEHSGPAPFELKEPLYERLIGNPAQHPAICASLLDSATFKHIDAQKARALVARLALPDNDETLQELRRALSGS